METNASTTAVQATCPAKHYLLVARGFACLLWSVPIGLLFLSGALQFVNPARMPAPAYLLAALLYIYGLLLLKRVPFPHAKWRQTLRTGLGQGLLLCYFAPFLVWWRWQPYHDHFFLNVLALFLTYCLALQTINRLAAEWAAFCQDRVLQVEARLTGWAVWFCVVAPVAVMLVLGAGNAWREGIPLFAVLEPLRYTRHFHGLLVLLLLPLTLTMAIAWKARERALDQVTMQAPPSWNP